MKHNPLEKRTFKYKNPSMEFFCPLCGTQRAFTSTPRLSLKNYAQCALTSIFLMVCLWPLMGVKSFFVFFIVWGIFEAALRVVFKKEIPCPHCGFDATWYKKDVKVARDKVKVFWDSKNVAPSSNNENTPQEA